MSCTWAYLINQYPKPAHTFIRREIAAVKGCGVKLAHVSICPTHETLVDPADRAELNHARALLDSGLTELADA